MCQAAFNHISEAFERFCSNDRSVEHYLVHKIGSHTSVVFHYVPDTPTGFYSMAYDSLTNKRIYTVDSADADRLLNNNTNDRLIQIMPTACSLSEAHSNAWMIEDIRTYEESLDGLLLNLQKQNLQKQKNNKRKSNRCCNELAYITSACTATIAMNQQKGRWTAAWNKGACK